MGVGLAAAGGFFEGLQEGYKSGTGLRLADEKNKREQAAFELQQERDKIELETKKREEAYQKDLRESLSKVQAEIKGGVVGGEAVDENGTSLGNMQFANQQEASNSLQSQGLRFKEGTAIEKKGLDPIEGQMRIADTLKEVAARHGKVDLKMLQESRDFGRKIKAEGAVDAMKYFMTNPNDQAGARERFNKNGDVKLGDDVQLGIKDGMFGPVVYGYKVGPKGEKIEVFDGFRDIILPSMSVDAYGSAMANFKTTEVKEKGENVRLGAKLASDESIAANKNKIDRAKLAQDGQKELNEIVKTRFTGIFRNPLDNAEAARQKQIEAAVARRAEEYYGTGNVGLQEAFDRAQTDVFRDFKVDTSELAPKKK